MKVYINPFVIPVLVLLIFCGMVNELIITVLSLIIHEGGHVVTAILLGKKIHAIRIQFTGFSIELKGIEPGNSGVIIVALIGPVINLVLAIIALLSSNFTDTLFLKLILIINLYIGILNLIPISPNDGSRILRELLYKRFGWYKASIILKKTSIFLIVSLSSIIIFCSFVNINFLILLLVFVSLFMEQSTHNTQNIMSSINNIMNKNKKILKGDIYPLRSITAYKSVQLLEIVKQLDFKSYCLIYVVDNELKIIKVYSEDEIIDGLIKNDMTITLEKYMEGIDRGAY